MTWCKAALCCWQAPSPSETLATANTMCALLMAQQLRQASSTTGDHQGPISEDHPDTGTRCCKDKGWSAGGSRGAERQSLCNEKDWEQCYQHAQKGLQAWQHSLADNGGSDGDWSEALPMVLELLFMTGLHGELVFLVSCCACTAQAWSCGSPCQGQSC